MSILGFILQQQPTQQQPGDQLRGFLYILVPFALIYYFILHVPMQRQKKQQTQMLANLQSGSEVLTTGGLVGTIVSISGDLLILRVKPDNVKLQVSRSAVSSLVKPDGGGEEKK